MIHDDLVAKLKEIALGLKLKANEQAELKRWNHNDGWWEVGGYYSILEEAIATINKHHRRHKRCTAVEVSEAIDTAPGRVWEDR